MRENLCLWSVSGAARNETWHVDDKCFRDTKMCDPEPSSSSATRVRVLNCVVAVQLCTCCICGCTVDTQCRNTSGRAMATSATRRKP